MNVSWRGSPKIGLHSGKASKLKAKKTVFVNEKRGLFFTPSTVRTFFWALPKPPKWWSKVAPKNTQRDTKSHALSALPVNKSYEHRNSRRYGEMGAALEDSARASKIRFLDGTVSPSLRRQEGRRRRMLQGCSEILWMLWDALGCPVRSSRRRRGDRQTEIGMGMKIR